MPKHPQGFANPVVKGFGVDYDRRKHAPIPEEHPDRCVSCAHFEPERRGCAQAPRNKDGSLEMVGHGYYCWFLPQYADRIIDGGESRWEPCTYTPKSSEKDED